MGGPCSGVNEHMYSDVYIKDVCALSLPEVTATDIPTCLIKCWSCVLALLLWLVWLMCRLVGCWCDCGSCGISIGTGVIPMIIAHAHKYTTRSSSTHTQRLENSLAASPFTMPLVNEATYLAAYCMVDKSHTKFGYV